MKVHGSTDVPDSKYKYGIVIDSGSSGSRIQIYKWPDPQYILKKVKDATVLDSPPQITQEPKWTKKTSPGISTYGGKVNKIWSDHFEDLVRFAEEIIPKDKHEDTPIFVLATAGMRLLSNKEQKKILKQTCSVLQKKSRFRVPDCDEHVQIIDGEVEGLYGWLGLNYLMGQLDDYKSDGAHESIGFMDMGGASTQIAFVPSSDEDVEKHREDISQVTLRNVNGVTQQWNVFVETWLGFGANQARNRYLTELVNFSRFNSKIGTQLSDPCMPVGAETTFKLDGKDYNIKGIGNYEMCIKTIYPLLMKNVPCTDTPCLFNGVHGPRLNFEKDKFVGISEYWYTANDVFQSGGEYNYKAFNERVKQYCESDWPTILSNSEKGQYSNLDPDDFLKDACFKASWVINVLHDGFELPRLDIEVKDDLKDDSGEITKVHVPFKSTDSIDGSELSWTLGKMLLYASSEIPPNNKKDLNIGVYPSAISGKKFVPAGGSIDGKGYNSDDDETDPKFLVPILSLIIIALVIYNFTKHRFGMFKSRRFNVRKLFFENVSKIPGVNQLVDAQSRYNQINQNEFELNMEEGTLASSQSSPNLTKLRTRSAINLNEARGFDDDTNNSFNTTNFLNKPFVLPKKSPMFYNSQNNSRESLQRSASSMSTPKARGLD